jgi:cell division protein FtsB
VQVALVVSLILIVLFAYAIPKTLSRISDLETEIRASESEVVCVDARFRTLSRIYEYVKSEEYRDTLMRTRYQYVESGETLIQITYATSEKTESTIVDETFDGWWWIPYFSLEDVLPECEQVGY